MGGDDHRRAVTFDGALRACSVAARCGANPPSPHWRYLSLQITSRSTLPPGCPDIFTPCGVLAAGHRGGPSFQDDDYRGLWL